ncbi:DUF86 domain-containing protein [Enterococcus gallinarum]|uniref:HepT-like ribonuclease domain-containing protein n=1 Tax=Enterococcus gallinarum TaxID=1353 RepID=UPI0018AAE494|nr:HepT-like ribonuclease domain-containing protein [Enterococcus gallinarum]
MKDNSKDLRILKGTLTYCEDIESTLNRFGKDYEVFTSDRVFFHAISMALMQIGELANKLSAGFKEKNQAAVDWQRLRYIRNVFAHAYSTINMKTVWSIANFFIPVYAEFCRQKIGELQKK